jgi:arylformamidase
MRVIDLTMSISPSIRVYPGSPRPSFIPWSKFDHYGYDSEAMFMSTHTGTHVDAPSHFKPGLASIDMISTDRLVCNAILIRVKKRANQLIEKQDLGNHQIRQVDAVWLLPLAGKNAQSGEITCLKTMAYQNKQQGILREKR